MARQEKRMGVEINVHQAGHNQKEDEGVVGLLHALTNETVGYSTVPPLVIYSGSQNRPNVWLFWIDGLGMD